MARLLLIFLAYMLPLFVSGTEKDGYELSTAIHLDEVGINKVLCMQNGFTMLFHFEIGKPIKVMVFDSSHNRLVSRDQQCRELDLFALPTSLFKGMYEVNKEAVLFFEQQNGGRHSLIMLRFNALNGKLIEERRVGRSKSLAKPSRFYVMKQKSMDGYQILFCQDAQQFRESRIHVAYYNNRHEQYRDVNLDFDRKNFDYMSVVGAEAQPDGICVTLSLSNMLINGTRSNMMTITTPVYKHFLQLFYIPADSTLPMQRNIDLSSSIIPYYTHFTHNNFAGTFNLMLLSYSDALYRYGIELRPTELLSSLFFTFDPQTLDGAYNWVTNKLANNYLMEKNDTSSLFSGFPLSMHTNRYGLSTVVSESYDRNISSESYARAYVQETYLGNLCITQLNDEGKEVWGTVLPKSQYYKSYRRYYNPADLAKRWQQQAMFNDMPHQVYERQFVSANIYNGQDGDMFIIYNDGSRELSDNIEDPQDTMFVSTISNACYYKLNKKKEITKKYLFGAPMSREYKSSFIEGADFDEQRNTYASVVRYKRGGYVSLRMAWATLD